MPFISLIFHMHTDRIPNRYLGLAMLKDLNALLLKYVLSYLVTPGPWLVRYFRSGKNPQERVSDSPALYSHCLPSFGYDGLYVRKKK